MGASKGVQCSLPQQTLLLWGPTPTWDSIPILSPTTRKINYTNNIHSCLYYALHTLYTCIPHIYIYSAYTYVYIYIEYSFIFQNIREMTIIIYLIIYLVFLCCLLCLNKVNKDRYFLLFLFDSSDISRTNFSLNWGIP